MRIPPSLTGSLRRWWDSLKRSSFLPWLIAWVFLFATLIAVAWVVIEEMVEEHRISGDLQAREQVQARAKSYARQFDDMTDRLEQVGDVLIEDWKRTGKIIEFERVLVGIYPSGTPFYISLLNGQGHIVSSSPPLKEPSLHNAKFFIGHRDHCCNGWQLFPAEYVQSAGLHLMHLTHPLVNPNGAFAGVIAFGMAADFLTAFDDGSQMGARDFVKISLLSGTDLATKMGAATSSLTFYKQFPQFSTAQGIRLEPGELFADGAERYVAWHKHPKMPVVIMAAIAKEDAMREMEGEVQIYRNVAWMMTAVLLLFCVSGAAAGIRLSTRRAAEEEVRQVYRRATDAGNEGFYMLRPLWNEAGEFIDFQFEDVNERGASLLKCERLQLIAQPASRTLPSIVFQDLLKFVRSALTKQLAEEEYRVLAEAEISSTWIFRRAVVVGAGVALTMRDISDVKAHQEELLELAHRDSLTGLPNRLWSHRFLPMAIQRAERANRQLAVLFIDLDNFKTVNDTLGHGAGDRLLKDVATHLKNIMRSGDHVVRLGGDEFLVILEDFDGTEAVNEVARKIIHVVEKEFDSIEGSLVKISASIGISVFPEDGHRPEELLRFADIAMYQSKIKGRGQSCWYRPEFSEQIVERLGTEQALRQALEKDELVVHYQPKVRARSGKLAGAEALVRWQRPERGLVMPSSFIELAEDIGLIVPLGEHIIKTVLAQMMEWQRNGLPEIKIAINVSPEQLRRSDIAAYLDQQLKIYGISPALIDVEITESTMVEHNQIVQGQLDRLRSMGVRLVIDDFGTGYSSLSQLQRLDVDVLKLDRELVSPLVHGSDAESLCRAIIWMASALELDVVAEGVETIEQLTVLMDIGCDELQGYLFSEPMSPEAFEIVLKQQQMTIPGYIPKVAAH